MHLMSTCREFRDFVQWLKGNYVSTEAHKELRKELNAGKRKVKKTAQERKVAESEGLELAFRKGVTLLEGALRMKKLCQKKGKSSKAAITARGMAKAKRGGVRMGESESTQIMAPSPSSQPPTYISKVD